MEVMNKTCNRKEQVSLIINSLIETIRNPHLPVNNSSYFYHPKEKKIYLIFLYLFKLLINDKDYLEIKYKNIKKNTQAR